MHQSVDVCKSGTKLMIPYGALKGNSEQHCQRRVPHGRDEGDDQRYPGGMTGDGHTRMNEGVNGASEERNNERQNEELLSECGEDIQLVQDCATKRKSSLKRVRQFPT